ncbi:nucleotidyltransferase family protein [Microbulbifer zhoushanensis]|uniref:nucleotidyltransferase family protein n=1 Tax=Microbulbifer zhoushanensis TaxID=2904254 RepID=UPI001F276EF9|nr:nucleotidyltransferase family protein [Microbulbifer zhoushanensis]
MEYAAILLAAGYSHRFGSDKRLADIDGEPMLLATLAGIRAALDTLGPGPAEPGRLQVVVRSRDGLVGRLLAGQGGELVRAPAWPVGIGASISAAAAKLASLDEPPRALAICPADMPFVRPESLCELLRHCAADKICAPVFAGQRGKPVVFGRCFLGQLAQLRARKDWERVIRANPAALCDVPVDDIGVTLDVDCPADFHRAKRRGPDGRRPAALHTASHGGP